MTYLVYKYKVEFEKEEYDEIDAYCKSRGIDWSASPWDEDSIDFLSDYKLPWVKIASASITEEDVLRKCAKIFPKIIMSTGMSTEEEIDRAVSVLESANCESICILHCNSSYPAPAEDLNLNYIRELKKKYPKHQIGYSGHEYGLTSSIASVALGAEVVERHVTLDKSMWGSDQLCSVEPHGMFKLARGIKELELALGDGIKVVTEDEKKKRKTLRK
jgi:N-acetylneuraminate synthase